MRTNMESMSRCNESNSARPHSLKRVAWRSGLMMVLASTSLAGCKSAMPKFNMFGFKREPSPDAIAGTGATSTYPVSPSSSANPEALASAAAGTAPSGTKPQTSNVAASAPPSYGNSPIAGATTKPSMAPANSSLASAAPTNNAAAAANGFYGQAPARNQAMPASYANATGVTGGYTYGQNPNAASPSGGIQAMAASYSPSASKAPGAVPTYAQTSPAAAANHNQRPLRLLTHRFPAIRCQVNRQQSQRNQ